MLDYRFIQNGSEMIGFFRRRRFRQVFFGLAGIFLTAFVIADYYCETVGVPLWAERLILRRLQGAGIELQASGIRIGVVNGMRMTDVRLTDSSSGIELQAPMIGVDFSPILVLRGILLPVSIELEAATLQAQVLPEYGEEAACDRLVISNLYAEIVGTKGLLQVRRASGTVDGVAIELNGTVDNLLHFSFAKGLESLRDRISPTRQDGPAAAPAEHASSVLFGVPLEIRRRLLYFSRRLQAKRLGGNARCSVKFHYDVSSFGKSTFSSRLEIPSLKWGNLPIRRITQSCRLESGVLSMEDAYIDLGDDCYISADVSLDSVNHSSKGSFTGVCRARDVLLLFDEQIRSGLLSNVKFGEKPIALSGKIDRFTFDGRLIGSLSADLPELVISGIPMTGVRLVLNSTENGLSGSLEQADLSGGGNVSGTFSMKDGSFGCSISGRALPRDIAHILSPSMLEFLGKNAAFQDTAKPISFSGKLKSSDWKNADFSGNFKVSAEGIRIKGADIVRIDAGIAFSPDRFELNDLSARLSDGSRLAGNLSCNPKNSTLSASVIFSSSPAKFIAALEPETRKHLQELTAGIEWPSAGNIMEGSADLHLDYGKSPFLFLNGSLVMNNFGYRGIHFKYGAARFLIDGSGRLVMPDIVLETDDGTLAMKAAYSLPDGRKTGEGVLDFQLASSLRGNDVIRILFPDWKSETVDFPFPITMESRGKIDYGDQNRTVFSALVANGSCVWSKVRIDDIGARLRFSKNVLSFDAAEAVFCGGHTLTDYSYDFSTGRGKIRQKLEGARLQRVITELGIGQFVSANAKSGQGSVSAYANADFSYNAKDELQLFGTGGVDITGDNLWCIPYMGGFLKTVADAWPMIDTGSISKINCTFTLDRDTVHITKLKSDGGIISLSASGQYQWNSREVNMTLRGELLKNALPFGALARILTPVSWITSRAIKGRYDNAKWE